MVQSPQQVGEFTFVLHSHLPYCRKAGRWPHGEEWLYEGLAETYIPLLNRLYDLWQEDIPFRLTISITPVLADQLADPDVQISFLDYIDWEIQAAEKDRLRFSRQGEQQLEYLADFYHSLYQDIKKSFEERFERNITAALKKLQDAGYIEISTSAATHGYLPLLSRDSSIYGQLRSAIENYRRHFGREPRTVWLPECAYRPAKVDPDGIRRPALEAFLSKLGLACFFAESDAIEKGTPGFLGAGDIALGPYQAIERRQRRTHLSGKAGTTYAAYIVVDPEGRATDPPVYVIGRNDRTGQQVWSGDWGYPGDADYREFHRKDAVSGLQYWRVTGPGIDLGDKDLYHPEWAANKVKEHARHFAWLVETLLTSYHRETKQRGLISSNYDTELFGHWWFEGVAWLEQVLRLLAQNSLVQLTTPTAHLKAHPPQEGIDLPEGSWGAGGDHWTWDNPETHWMWEPIHAAERRMEALVAKFPAASEATQKALNQAARELLLLQASDWPFLITTRQAKEYAEKRFRTHIARFHELADLLESNAYERAGSLADRFYELDKVFPEIDYRWFAERQGRAD